MKQRLIKLFQLVRNLVWILRISYAINRPKFIIRIVTTILYAVFPIVSYWFLKQIIDSALALRSSDYASVKPIIYLIALKISFDVGWYFLDTFLEGMFKIMRFDLEAYFAEKIVMQLNRLDLEFFENSDFLDLKQKALDTYTWRPTEMLNIAFWSLYNLLQIVIQSTIIARLNYLWLSLLFMFQIPSLIILIKLGQSAWNIWEADSTTRRKFQYFSSLFENLAYVKEFALYNVGGYFIGKINALMGHFHARQKKIERKRVIYGFGGIFLSNLPGLYITVNLLLMLVRKEISPGLLTFYLSNLAAFSAALSNLVKNINYGYEVNLYIKEIRRFLQIDAKVKNGSGAKMANDDGEIEFKNISFSYPNSKRRLFSNFSLRIAPNQKIALVGENGSGKTTLIKLLCRFYDVQKGSITVNGVDIRKVPLVQLRSRLAVLFQDYVGYDLTVMENIAMGRIDQLANQRTVRHAALMAGADEFINTLPDRYRQQLGTAFTNGEQLSIGQWQRIALAKAFMRNSPIMILDEPTAAVDAKTENEIFNKVMTLIKNKTVIMVSHRFSTVRHADEIVVLKQGKMIERGNHQALMKANGEYAQMFSLQAKAYN
ncbi:ABC transporter ATP-binding protein/permease [Patescibacteria group bacterium]|nr:ABC transporter ATP-binding protein/permease [Patescibacteria group bacterium]MCL5091290.1 ABC transporter ATP-binding protein/permease [Patescibacteria group bacterium]